MAQFAVHRKDAMAIPAQRQESRQESVEDIRRLAQDALMKAIAAKPPAKAAAPFPSSSCTARECSDVAELRLQAQRALIQAASDGRLATALAGKCKQSKTQGKLGSQPPGAPSRSGPKRKTSRVAFTAPPMPREEDPRDLDELLRELGEESPTNRNVTSTVSKRKGTGKALKLTDSGVLPNAAPAIENASSAEPLMESLVISCSASMHCSQEDISSVSACLKSDGKNAALGSGDCGVTEMDHLARTITAGILESCVVGAGTLEVAEEQQVHSCTDDTDVEGLQNLHIMTPVRRKGRGRKHSWAALTAEVSLPANQDRAMTPAVAPAAEEQASSWPVQPALAEVQVVQSMNLPTIDRDLVSRQRQAVQPEPAAHSILPRTATIDRAVQTRSKLRLPKLPPPPKGMAPPPPEDMQLWPSTPECTPVPSPRGCEDRCAGSALEHRAHTTELGVPGSEIAVAGQPGAWLFIPTHLLADVQRVITMSGCVGPEAFKQAAYGLPLAACCDTPWAT
eukprot:TRINITY_DN91505_c0_g1_i1.p1 TRINITY_DN91505_c0_g1~~TRINITY_DN91505_c0_g1_i1.p1  ORF type:complete len:509 (-),score=103.38 TRINITY_DN91505_c0_g1_i1:406-1932(-)